jgi:hypothetical protein
MFVLVVWSRARLSFALVAAVDVLCMMSPQIKAGNP